MFCSWILTISNLMYLPVFVKDLASKLGIMQCNHDIRFPWRSIWSLAINLNHQNDNGQYIISYNTTQQYYIWKLPQIFSIHLSHIHVPFLSIMVWLWCKQKLILCIHMYVWHWLLQGCSTISIISQHIVLII